MFCPRCGRAINENANFCGGCGLSRVEIEKFAQAAKVTNEAAQQPPVTEAAAAQEVKSEVPFGTVVNEPVSTPTAEAQPDCQENGTEKSDAERIKEIFAEDIDPVKAEPQTEAPKAEPAAQSSSYTAPKGAEYHYSANNTADRNGTAQNTTQYSYSQPEPVKKNENLSTVDFIWMMIISSLPVIGLIYLIYLAIQDNNTNKRSYARATLIISVFATVVAIVFLLGFIIAGI